MLLIEFPFPNDHMVLAQKGLIFRKSVINETATKKQNIREIITTYHTQLPSSLLWHIFHRLKGPSYSAE